MLHLLWPFLWIWAMMYQPDRGWGFGQKPGEPASPKEAVAELEELRRRMAEVEAKLESDDRGAQLRKEQRPPAIGSPGSLVSAAEEGVTATEVAAAESQGARR